MDDLARRLASGDASAFETLYDACADRVHHYLVARLGCRSDADDVLQETFVRLARTRRKLAMVENLRAYVFATARHEASRLVERRGRERRRQSTLSASSTVFDKLGHEPMDLETMEWVVLALEHLGDEYREVLMLKIYGGLTFREIAQATGLPQGTVATRYRSALEKLRDHLVKESG
jgi:RNA polymerase sigma-70 factor (ECF subfamily)